MAIPPTVAVEHTAYYEFQQVYATQAVCRPRSRHGDTNIHITRGDEGGAAMESHAYADDFLGNLRADASPTPPRDSATF